MNGTGKRPPAAARENKRKVAKPDCAPASRPRRRMRRMHLRLSRSSAPLTRSQDPKRILLLGRQCQTRFRTELGLLSSVIATQALRPNASRNVRKNKSSYWTNIPSSCRMGTSLIGNSNHIYRPRHFGPGYRCAHRASTKCPAPSTLDTPPSTPLAPSRNPREIRTTRPTANCHLRGFLGARRLCDIVAPWRLGALPGVIGFHPRTPRSAQNGTK